jgi:hypothetical protein
MAINSLFCSDVVNPGFEGQSMFPTVAIQTPRNSRAGLGGASAER